MRKLYVAAMTVMMVGLFALPAAATTAVGELNDGFSDIVSDLTSIVTTNIPVLMGLLGLVIGLSFVIRLVRRHAKP